MTLPAEYLPAREGAGPELVLLHGWGASREVWRPLLTHLRGWASVTLLDIPGLAPGQGDGVPELERVLADILQQSPPQAVYLGWSLGGQLALELASRHPDRVLAVATLCTSPRFTATPDWPGTLPSVMAAFNANCRKNPEKTLRRFDSLQITGAEQQRPLLRQLQALRGGAPDAGMAAGLSWLEHLDQRDTLGTLGLPQLHLLGAHDSLHSPQLAPALAELLQLSPGASLVSLEACSHLAPLERPDLIDRELRRFLGGSDLLSAAGSSPQLAKADVAESFSRAAREYDTVAQLQRDVGDRLLQQLDAVADDPAEVLDLGSGTGHFSTALKRAFPGAHYLGLDLAEGMIRYSREAHPTAGSWLVADAEALPLAAESVDLVFSSLAIQWCQRPELLFAELARVLRPGGRCVFTTLGPGTLRELRSAWAAVDERQHVNEFLPLGRLQDAAARTPGLDLEVETRPFRMEYQQVRELLNELKTLGAHNVNRGRPSGLTGRRALQGMLRAYEDWRENGLLPASYEVYFGTLVKT